MPLLLVLLFIIVPIAELALLIQVGQLIGVWWTVAILIADALLGSFLLRTQSRAAWQRFNDAINRRADPAPGGRGRRAGDLRRRPAADARLHHRHLRPAVPVPAHADPAARAARPARRAAGSSARCRARRRRRPTAACATPTTSRATPSTSTPTIWTRRDERPRSSAPAQEAGRYRRGHVLVGRRGDRAVRPRPRRRPASARTARSPRARSPSPSRAASRSARSPRPASSRRRS